MREAHLRDLIAVIDNGSVRAAARKLGLSQSAISKNLSALERSLGVPLLVRTPHGVEPTNYGRLVLRRARVVDTELRKLQEEIDDLAGESHACVTIGLSATVEAMLLAGAVTRFRQRNPDTLVSVMGGRSASTVAALREGKIDFAIGPLPQGAQGNDLHFERLLSSDLALVARASHPLAACTDLAALAQVAWISAVRQPHGDSPLAEAFAQRGLPPPTIAAHCDSPSAMLYLLLSSDMLTLASLNAVKPFCQPGLLAVLPIQIETSIVQHLITSAQRPLTAAATALAAEFRKASRRFRR